MLLDDIPVAGEVWVGGSTLKDDRGATQQQRRVHNVGVAGNPANITTAEEAVIIVDVKGILSGYRSAQEIAGGGVHNTLGLSSRARGVEQKQRVFRVDRGRRQVVGVLLDLLVPPQVTALGPGHLGASPLVDQAGVHFGALLERLIDNALGANHLAATLSLIGGDNNLGAGVNQTVAEGVRRKTSENHGVNGTDTGAGQEGNQGLGNHGQVDAHGVALLDTLLLQSPGDTGDFAEQLAIGDDAAIIGLVGFIDNGGLVGVLDSMTINTVVGGIQATTDEPGIVAMFEGADMSGIKVAVKGEMLAGHARPEDIGVTDRLFVQFLVLGLVLQVSLGRVPLMESRRDREGLNLVAVRCLTMSARNTRTRN